MTRKILFVLIALALLVGIAAADSMFIPDASPSINMQKSINVRLSATEGLSGYNITFTMENSTVAQIYSVSFPAWATLHTSSGDPGSVVITVASDLGDAVTAPTVNEDIVTLTIKGLAVGTTTLYATANQIDDDDGGEVDPAITNGTITVSATVRPLATSTIALVNETPYDALMGLFGGNSTDVANDTSTYLPDMPGFMGIIAGVYSDPVGNLALVIIFALPFLMMWIMGENVTLPSVVGIILGGFILYRLPESYHMAAVAFIALSVLAIIYSLMKERM